MVDAAHDEGDAVTLYSVDSNGRKHVVDIPAGRLAVLCGRCGNVAATINAQMVQRAKQLAGLSFASAETALQLLTDHAAVSCAACEGTPAAAGSHADATGV